MGAILLAKNFSFVAASGQFVYGDWVEVDSRWLQGNIHVHCQTLSPPGAGNVLAVGVQTSADGVESNETVSPINVNQPGSYDQPIPGPGASIERLVRLKLQDNTGSFVMGILSVWLDLETA